MGPCSLAQDARLYAAHFREQRDSIDGLVICLPNFGDEIAISELVNEARLNVPILLQASNDEIDKVDVHSRRDAFCGKFSVTNNFYQYGVPFTDTTSHTSDVSGEEFGRDLDRFARICRVVRGLRHARIGSIGARTGAFQTMRFSEKLLQASGMTVVTVDLSEIIFSANALADDAPEVKAKLEEIAAYGRIPAYIKREKIVRQAKWTIAVDRWIEENECDASAIQCWRSLQDNFGCATCVTMSMMGEKLMPSACEVDVMGAISMYALALAAEAPSAILDWNNNYGREPDKCVCTHCGNYPESFIGEKPEISELDVLGTVLGKENCFGAVKGKVKAGPMTFFRASTDDRLGTIKAYVGEGAFTDDPFAMDGGIAVTRSIACGHCSASSRATASSTMSQWCAVITRRPCRRPSRAICNGPSTGTKPNPPAIRSSLRFSGCDGFPVGDRVTEARGWILRQAVARLHSRFRAWDRACVPPRRRRLASEMASAGPENAAISPTSA